MGVLETPLADETSARPPAPPPLPAGWVARWWVYQRERFPVFAHGLLIAAFSFSAVSYSALLRGAPGVGFHAALVAFANSFLAFLQLRIADEFKDAEEDRRHRPYRAVPRGLVSLRGLGMLGALSAATQLALALSLNVHLLPLLLATWTYLALMSREFFARDWLKARPITYLWTHMLIMPLIDFYATGCDWLPAGLRLPPAGLGAFLGVSFCNGVVIEIGRKLRAPVDEEAGVPTYTALWGRTRAVAVWWAALASTAAVATFAAGAIHFRLPVAIVLAAGLLTAGFVGRRFLRDPSSPHARPFERVSGLWTLAMYLSLGAVPLALHSLGWR